MPGNVDDSNGMLCAHPVEIGACRMTLFGDQRIVVAHPNDPFPCRSIGRTAPEKFDEVVEILDITDRG